MAVLALAGFEAVSHLRPTPGGLPVVSRSIIVNGNLLMGVVRTGPTQASVVGVALTSTDIVQLYVDGKAMGTTTPLWNLDYWFLHVPVVNGSQVQVQIGTVSSPVATVPAYVPQLVGPPGFIYAQGPNLMINGSAIQLFGVDDQYAFIDSLVAAGLWGSAANPSYYGHNGLFPLGPDGFIPNVTSADAFWKAYFQYFLHYENVSTEPYNPRPNLLRIWVADDSWYPDGTYNAWQSNPTAFWAIFDSMVYWAGRAGIYLVPVLGHFSNPKDNTFFDTSSTHYAHQVALVRAITSRYNNNRTIAMWDLWNEPDVDDDTYWASVGGITGFKAWATHYLADVKPYSSNHLLNMGIGGWTLFPGVPSFGWQFFFFFDDIPGLEVTSLHGYGTAEDQYLIDWETGWHQVLGLPHYEGEFGYNLYPGPCSLGYGYWPWYAATTRASGWPAISTMVFLDNGKGPYSDYPYSGPLPSYPASGSPAPPPPPPPSGNTTSGNSTAAPAAVTDLIVQSTNQSSAAVAWTAPGANNMTGQATWYDFRYSSSGLITQANFGSAIHYELPFFPGPAGTAQAATIGGLQASTKYWFALETANSVPTWSSISNVPNGTTATPPPPPPPPTDTTPPSVAFLSPVNGSTVSGTVQVSVQATDDTAVASVSLYADSALLGTDSVAPYTWTWSTSGLKKGSHTLQAIARDTSGNQASAVESVKVRNSPRILALAWNPTTSSVDVMFSMPMNQSSVASSVGIAPASAFTTVWTDTANVSFRLTGSLQPGQSYTVTINQSATDTEGTPLGQDTSYVFIPIPGIPGIPIPESVLNVLGVALVVAALGMILASRRRRHTAHTVERPSHPDPRRRERPTSPPRRASMREPSVTGPEMASYAAWLDGIEAEIAAPAHPPVTRKDPGSARRMR